MKKVFGFLMVLSFIASWCFAECIPACLGCFLFSVLIGAVIYRMEMRE